MNFSDKMKNEPLPFEDIDVEVEDDLNFMEEHPIVSMLGLNKSLEEKHKEVVEVLSDKMDIFMEMNQRLIDKYGIEDKEERYRLLELIVEV